MRTVLIHFNSASDIPLQLQTIIRTSLFCVAVKFSIDHMNIQERDGIPIPLKMYYLLFVLLWVYLLRLSPVFRSSLFNALEMKHNSIGPWSVQRPGRC